MASTSTQLPNPDSTKVMGIKADHTDYQIVLAVKVIIRNSKNKILILSAKKDDYYKLPGGGVDVGEDHQTAVQREVMKEAKCMIEVVGDCIAAVEEYGGHLHQISYCYCAELVADTGVMALTDHEVVEGLEHVWVSVERALEMMKGCWPLTKLGKSIRERDIFLLEASQNGKSSSSGTGSDV
ncbi:MAG: hypothetical protein ALECFALPRED_003749 [Alectoria fallacina]|uniref:Nudix hydrolase domain-containing protein n=1 Tax=Alectoria fallacina TaxID=1903189 RepID=A0A8H3ENJ1_9LECA|nr:MAG: hypothetical protein ALECFALPRED_003749 [Alectoria fallacina]